MQLTKESQERLYQSIADTIIAHADELTELDQAIGDGDHGFNMQRGFDAVLEELPAIVALDVDAALKKLGMTLVMKVGGASGPLFGTLFMDLAKTVGTETTLAQFGEALVKAADGVKKRGKSDVGAKTMLDVLVPVAQAMASEESIETLKTIADASADSTIPMLATRGRASFLKERSIGHLDPGARSMQLVIYRVCDFFSEPEQGS